MKVSKIWRCLGLSAAATTLLAGQTAFGQMGNADDLRGVNQLRNPSFEDEGPGGEGDVDLWTANQRPWGTRIQPAGGAHSGDWSLEVDNTVSNDWGQWKELKTNDPGGVDDIHIGGEMINPADGETVLPSACTACYPIIPGESYTQSIAVKLLEEFIPTDGVSTVNMIHSQPIPLFIKASTVVSKSSFNYSYS